MFLFKRISLTLAILLCLSLSLLFTGCDPGNDFVDDGRLNTKLIGTWISYWGEDGDYDSYTITDNSVSYVFASEDWGNNGFIGAIRHVANFSNSAGVIIIEYNSGDFVIPGQFIGIYYQDLNPGASVRMGTAWADGGAEELTLAAAIAAFTLGNEGKYMSSYGTYLSNQ